MWSVYRHPDDYPSFYVVRRMFILPGRVEPAAIGCLYWTLGEARHDLPDGLVRLPPDATDAPALVETWV